MMQRASTEGPEEGTAALTTTSTFLRLQPARSNDNDAQKSVSQMDDNNEQERSRGAEGNDNYTCNEARRTTTTTRRRRQQHLREDHQFGREERDREPGDNR